MSDVCDKIWYGINWSKSPTVTDADIGLPHIVSNMHQRRQKHSVQLNSAWPSQTPDVTSAISMLSFESV